MNLFEILDTDKRLKLVKKTLPQDLDINEFFIRSFPHGVEAVGRVPYDKNTSDFYHVYLTSYEFKNYSSSDIAYSLDFDQGGKGAAITAFDIPFTVFSAVVTMARALIEKEKPIIIVISNVVDEPKRFDIYRMLANKFAKELNYKVLKRRFKHKSNYFGKETSTILVRSDMQNNPKVKAFKP